MWIGLRVGDHTVSNNGCQRQYVCVCVFVCLLYGPSPQYARYLPRFVSSSTRGTRHFHKRCTQDYRQQHKSNYPSLHHKPSSDAISLFHSDQFINTSFFVSTTILRLVLTNMTVRTETSVHFAIIFRQTKQGDNIYTAMPKKHRFCLSKKKRLMLK